jgi:CheY-like chemotaxis protein
MASSQKISVHLIGIDLKEQHFIKVVFKLSESRNREYQIISEGENIRESFLRSDIVIVDKDNEASVKEWNTLLKSSGNKHSSSSVFLTRVKSTAAQKNIIQKPLVALRILNILDQIEIVRKDDVTIIQSDRKIPQVTEQPEQPGYHNVLVIDDSLAVRQHIGNELNKYQCKIDYASNAEEGYWSIQKNMYSLVFLDIILPGMNGHQLCKDIKGNSLLRNTPIVMLTSKSSPFDRVKGRLSGCNDYLTKPVKVGKLHQIIEKYLVADKAIATSP